MGELKRKTNIDSELADLLDQVGVTLPKEGDSSKESLDGNVLRIKGKAKQNPEARDGERKRGLSPYFYKVANHHELFRIGTSYFQDFKKGVKSFAISSTGYQASQQRTILGLASFFDHQEELRIAIISDNLFLGSFKDLVQASKTTELHIDASKSPLEVHSFYQHFEFIDLNLIVEQGTDPEVNYDEFLDAFIDSFDVIFWDVPELFKIQNEKEIFFPIVMRYESLSIIVAKKNTGQEELEKVRSFFMGYGINLKGLLLDTIKEVAEEKSDNSKSAAPEGTGSGTSVGNKDKINKPWWRRWFR